MTTPTRIHPQARQFLVLVRITSRGLRGQVRQVHLADDAVDGLTLCGLRLAHVRQAGLATVDSVDQAQDPAWAARCGRCWSRLTTITTGRDLSPQANRTPSGDRFQADPLGVQARLDSLVVERAQDPGRYLAD